MELSRFFNCKGIKRILNKLVIEIDPKNIVCSVFPKEKAYVASTIIKILCFSTSNATKARRITLHFINLAIIVIETIYGVKNSLSLVIKKKLKVLFSSFNYFCVKIEGQMAFE